MMKLLMILLLVGVAVAQFDARNFFRPRQNNFSPRFRPNNIRPQQQRFRGGSQGGGAVDNTFGGSDYHYSWRHAGRNTKWVHRGAVNYCSGVGFSPISIESHGENNMVSGAISRDNIEYIWTSGQRRGNSFVWASGARAFPGGSSPWSRTGANRRPQPDNRERGGENCLAILNNFYNDGITWHDVGCSHMKPIICERSSRRG